MHALRMVLTVGLAFGAGVPLEAGPIIVPSDLAVSLTAEPNVNLRPGDLVSFTISITNNGPESVDRFALTSSPIYDELDVLEGGSSDCDHLYLAVVDLTDTFYYEYIWYPAWPGETPLQVGETRYCYLTLPYTQWAPPEFPVTFSPGTAFGDLDPSNNSATVILRGAGAAVTSVPTLSRIALAALVALMALLGTARCRSSTLLHSRQRTDYDR